MTPIERLSELFPRWKMTPTLADEFARELAKVDDEQATAIVSRHRRIRKGNDPCLATLGAQVGAALEQSVGEKRAAEQRASVSPGPMSASVRAWAEREVGQSGEWLDYASDWVRDRVTAIAEGREPASIPLVEREGKGPRRLWQDSPQAAGGGVA